MPPSNTQIISFFLVTSSLILVLVGFILTILYLYYRKHLAFVKSLEEIRLNHERSLLKTELEIQEQTFQNISREIHDNISLGLTLAKLNINTASESGFSADKLSMTVRLISEALHDLSNLSKSLSSDLIQKNGFIKALDAEIENICQVCKLQIEHSIVGETVYFDKQKELILFRVVQELLNNIIKHSKATYAEITIRYEPSNMMLSIKDNGIGFELCRDRLDLRKSGLNNIRQRVKILNGDIGIESIREMGTFVTISIPY